MYSLFSYKDGNSFLHRMPSWLKVLIVPVLNILFFSLNWRFACAAILVQAVLFFAIKFTLLEQLRDLQPVIWYAVFLYIINFISQLYLNYGKLPLSEYFFESLKNAFLDKGTAFYVAKFFACNQCCSLMFKTSTSLELRYGIETIEIFIRKILPVKKEPRFAFVISMFINFIPAVFKLWSQLKRAWIARGGKNSLRMVFVLIPQLFSVGLKYAYNTARAVAVRTETAVRL